MSPTNFSATLRPLPGRGFVGLPGGGEGELGTSVEAGEGEVGPAEKGTVAPLTGGNELLFSKPLKSISGLIVWITWCLEACGKDRFNVLELALAKDA